MRVFGRSRRAMWWAAAAVLALAGSAAGVAVLRPADSPSTSEVTPGAEAPSRSTALAQSSPTTAPVAGERPLLVADGEPVRLGGVDGNFRVECHYSHQSYDDPIVFPGKAAATHLHTFFGNVLADAKSTAASLKSSGESTCHGGTINRSAYWIPAVLDANDKVRVPKVISVYYKSAGLDPARVQPLPVGLKMLAGDANAGRPQWDLPARGPHHVEWNCLDGEKSPTIPSCRGELRGNIAFPQCWDGKGLEPSALRYPDYDDASRLACPAGFDVVLPRVEYTMVWDTGGSTSGWRLSSDRPGQAGGTTLHGDWFGAWDDQIMNDFVVKCINARLDCQDGQLGDGRQLVRPEQYSGPIAISKP